jgi:hypothetical protein
VGVSPPDPGEGVTRSRRLFLRDLLWVIVAVLPLAALPWTVRYWVSEDNLNHFAVAHVLRHFHDPGTPWSEYLRLQPGPRPYCLLYDLSVLLQRLLSAPTVDKLLFSLLILGTPLASFALLARTVPERRNNVHLVTPVIASSTTLTHGNLPFVLGVVAAIASTAALAGPPGSRLRGRDVALAGLLMFVATYAHPFSALLPAIAACWRLHDAAGDRRTRLASLGFVFAPSVLLFLLTKIPAGLPVPPPLCEPGWWYTAACPGLVPGFPLLQFVHDLTNYSRWELPIRGACWALLLWSVARAVHTQDGWRTWYGRTAVVLILVMLLAPDSATQRFFFIEERILPLICILLTMLAAPAPRLKGPALKLLSLGLCAALALAEHAVLARESEVAREVVAATRELPRGARLAYINPSNGEGIHVEPEQFLWAYPLVEHDVIVRALFADGSTAWGGIGYRPFAYKRSLPRCQPAMGYEALLASAREGYDYLLVVRAEGDVADMLPRLRADLVEVAHVGNAWLFRTHP